MKETYEINNGTLAIIPLDQKKSKVLEDNTSYIISQNVMDIVNHSCMYFGSSYKGRVEGTKSILGANYKLPIIINDNSNLIFFPTTSPSEKNCMWISFNKIMKFDEGKFNTTLITFDNLVELAIPISFRTVELQMYRSSRLGYMLKERNHKNKITVY